MERFQCSELVAAAKVREGASSFNQARVREVLRKESLREPSENFLGLKYCDNTHNTVTIHTIFILYNKMNNK